MKLEKGMKIELKVGKGILPEGVVEKVLQDGQEVATAEFLGEDELIFCVRFTSGLETGLLKSDKIEYRILKPAATQTAESKADSTASAPIDQMEIVEADEEPPEVPEEAAEAGEAVAEDAVVEESEETGGEMVRAILPPDESAQIGAAVAAEEERTLLTPRKVDQLQQELQQEIDALTRENLSLMEQLASVQAERDEAVRQREVNNAELTQRTQAVAEIGQRIAALGEERDNLAEEIERLRQRLTVEESSTLHYLDGLTDMGVKLEAKEREAEAWRRLAEANHRKLLKILGR